MSVTTPERLHLTPDDYHVIRPEDFGAPGLVARESVGPFTSVQALGTLVTVHDSTFEPRRGIGHHPHQRMERLFYILEGTVDHDDVLNRITGHMGTGDLGILTEGRRGMIHSEWNNGDDPARAYIFVYPTDPTPPTAAFDAIRDAEAPRVRPAPGVLSKHVIAGGSDRLHGDMRQLSDSTVETGATVEWSLGPEEAGLAFVVDGTVEIGQGGDGDPSSSSPATREHTILFPPVTGERTVTLRAVGPSRVLLAATGPGFGFRTR